ncbi:family 1 glycosylhydrolase [Sphingomonas endolithica]|uniref:family 1 glycosylhydrolase n=1 Tax=Sphingomonas endolithica TaxID=2972485 RepID=UPI0021AEE1DB|nr:family 1 glycosylhydrolase [Sphingomonas sp. ZFBP2030]
MDQMQLWGGPECTVNRIGDAFQDQFRLSGHHDRLEDIDLFADLGLNAIRYPVSWERLAPDHPGVYDWRWIDSRLDRLRARGLNVVAGLVHHGNGPHYTNLLDPDFPAGLGRFAGDVARRYPWIEDWTPVNEPVTTARFSALYGFWYPHRRDEGAFWQALLNQIDGTRLAMREIRRITPGARLVQTDDLGRTYATAPLSDQAGFDNQRRWASWDLLFGRIVPGHPLYDHIGAFGLTDRMKAIADDPCPPDIVGINHYLTSDRLLDHRFHAYPEHSRGGNDRLPYADVEAVRVLEPGPAGLAGALRETWDRYAAPIAITEVHNGCTREEQMRWMAEAWDTALAARAEGIQVDAVTSWALLGSYGWDTLLTRPGQYEPGVFDLRSGAPRATAMTGLLKALAAGGPRHPVCAQPGWWRRDFRLVHAPLSRAAPIRQHAMQRQDDSGRPLLITGATGTLGRAFQRACIARGITAVLTDRAALSLDDPTGIAATLAAHDPWAVVNAAGWVRVDDAEADEEACHAANAVGAINLAKACSDRGIKCLAFSSDLVFDGIAGRAYREEDVPAPLNAYGRSKAAMERGIQALADGHLIIRTAAFFSHADSHNFAAAVHARLSQGLSVDAVQDEVVSPTFVPHLVDACLDLLIDGQDGIVHLSGDEGLSWAEFARRIADACGLDDRLVKAVAGAGLNRPAARPRSVALESRLGRLVPPLSVAIADFARHKLLELEHSSRLEVRSA